MITIRNRLEEVPEWHIVRHRNKRHLVGNYYQNEDKREFQFSDSVPGEAHPHHITTSDIESLLVY